MARSTVKAAGTSAVVIKRSRIAGRGGFAGRDIVKGERLIEYVGERVSHAVADSRYDDASMRRHHTFLFTGAVKMMKELIDGDELGKLYYYDSVRINLGLFQHDINVVWDLAPHDFSIMDYLLGPKAQAVSAHGRGHFDTGLEDVAYVSVFYPDNLIAHFHVNWLSPVKLRRTVIGGAKKMLLWDDLNKEEQLKIYDKGMDVKTQEGLFRILATPRHGAMHAPIVPAPEALGSEVEYFAQCIHAGQQPHNGARAGARIVELLEATDRSLKADGRTIELD